MCNIYKQAEALMIAAPLQHTTIKIDFHDAFR